MKYFVFDEVIIAGFAGAGVKNLNDASVKTSLRTFRMSNSDIKPMVGLKNFIKGFFPVDDMSL
jgi:hypothetical protein